MVKILGSQLREKRKWKEKEKDKQTTQEKATRRDQ